MRDVLDPLLAPAEARLKKPKGWKAEAPDDVLDLASSLERVPAAASQRAGRLDPRAHLDVARSAAVGGARPPRRARAGLRERPPRGVAPRGRAVDRAPAPREVGRAPHRDRGRRAARARDGRSCARRLRSGAARGGAPPRRRWAPARSRCAPCASSSRWRRRIAPRSSARGCRWGSGSSIEHVPARREPHTSRHAPHTSRSCPRASRSCPLTWLHASLTWLHASARLSPRCSRMLSARC